MKETTLSLCMIARNESGNIGRCLRSARDFVDEIIVLDNGSTDDTGEIARALGATVIEASWRDDFSLARNASIERAAGDWIIFLDCDEELAPGNGRKLRELIGQAGYEAFFVQVENLTEINARLTAPSIRLFRNRPVFRFEGRIHEQIAGSIIANYGHQSIGNSDLCIIHHGYNAQQANIKAKIRRNLRILTALPDSERNGFFYYNLGTEHLRLGENEKALACFLESAGLTAPNQGYGPILSLRTATTLMELHRYRDALRHLQYYQSIYKEFNDLVFLEAICHLNCGRYSLAGERLQRYFTMPPAPSWYPAETIYFGASAEEFRDWLQERIIHGGKPGLSACIIGRDEAGRVGACIRSLSEIAREVIFVDTGSTDDTLAIAHQSGAGVYSFSWTGSFADARNHALRQAAGEWVLVLDADESLAEEGGKQIAELLGRAGPDDGGYLFRVCTFLDAACTPANCQAGASCRLFRRAPGGRPARYRGAAGEDVTASLLESGKAVTPVEITVNHLHYQDEQAGIARKRQWKTGAIEQGLRQDPAQRHYMLGVEEFHAREYAAAIDHFAACRRQEKATARPPSFFYYYGLSLINKEEYGRALEILKEGAERFTDYTDLQYLQAIALFLTGSTGAAETLLRRCLEMGETPWQSYLASTGTGSFKAMCSLGAILAGQGDIPGAQDLLLDAACLSGGLEQAIEGLAALQDRSAAPLEEMLAGRGILNSESLAAASGAFAGRRLFKDSIRYLDLACEQAARAPAPRKPAGIVHAVELLTRGFCQAAGGALPEGSPFRSLSVQA